MTLDQTIEHASSIELARYRHGRILDEDRCRWIERHLEVCQACQSALALVEPDAFEQKVSAVCPPNHPRHARVVEAYELLDEIGRGGGGIVFRARQRQLGRNVALKMMLGGAVASPAHLARFRREAAALALLSHPNIVQIHDCGDQDGVPYLTMELVEGPTLAQYLNGRLLGAREAASLVAEIAGAVELAHAKGILHRDLKPHNVLLVPNHTTPAILTSHRALNDFTPKIGDFGLSHFDDDSFRTLTGEALGTPSYIAPEMIDRKLAGIGPATDVYGLGGILYQCLAGRPPFVGESNTEILSRVLQRDVAPIRWWVPQVPRDLQTICHRCLEKNPARRFSSVADLRADLERFLAGKPIVSRGISRSERIARWCRRHPWPVAVIGVLTIAAALVVALTVRQQQQLTSQRDIASANYDRAREAIWQMLASAETESSVDIPRLMEMTIAQRRSALALFEKLAAQEKTGESQLDLANIQIQLGSSLIATGEIDEGQALILAAQKILTSLIQEHPDDDDVQFELIKAYIKLGSAFELKKQFPQAEHIFEIAVQLADRVVAHRPNDPRWINHMAWALHSYAGCLFYLKKLEPAARNYERSVNDRQRAAELEPDRTDTAVALAETQSSLASTLLAMNQLEAADLQFQKALKVLQAVHTADPKNLQVDVSMAITCLNLSNLAAGTVGKARAVDYCSQGIDSVDQCLDFEPKNVEARSAKAMLHGNRAMYSVSGRPMAEIVQDWRIAVDNAVDDPTRQYCSIMLARSLARCRQFAESLALARSQSGQDLSADNQFFLAAAWSVIAAQLELANSKLKASGQSDIEFADEFFEISAETIRSCLDRCWKLLKQLAEQAYFVSHTDYARALLDDDDFAAVANCTRYRHCDNCWGQVFRTCRTDKNKKVDR